MKTSRIPLALLLVSTAVQAQNASPSETSPNQTVVTAPASTLRTAEELDQLLAPVALYPDALIALILPAATVPTDIVLAARHLQDNPGDRSQIEHRAWDESVKSLTHYPDVVKWMDENLHWTRQVGEAFALQPADVMQAVQRLRAKARAAGTLADTPQQQVISEQQVIRIVPAQPDIIYVPQYEPEVVFVDRPVYYSQPFISFGVGFPVGSWLAYDCDWRHNSIWIGNRHRHWKGHDWRRPLVPFAHSYSHNHSRHVSTPSVRKWHPSTHSVRSFASSGHRFHSEIVRPSLFSLSHTSRSHHSSGSRSLTGSSHRSDSRSGSRSTSFRDSPSSRSSGFGVSGPTVRHSVSTPPVVPAMPRSFSPGFRHDNAGPRVGTPAVVPPLATARANSIDRGASTPRLPSLPQARASTNVGPQVRSSPSTLSRSRSSVSALPQTRSSVNSFPPARSSARSGISDFGNRSRSFRSSQPTVTAPLSVAPALPRATSSRSAHATGPRVQRSLPQQRASAPTVVPALPRQSRSTAPRATVGPSPQAAPAAAAAAPAASQRGGSSGAFSRGHRGGSFRGR